ncbi:hypothetical protein BS47DRAFT_854475 [Hydnum rufescens UP504]|uniref:Uncharacterized protein n=1 Tax=Hydnum rufescens UP504 TaxID=1448309 RepID=A0A9P6AZ23_9AGAM|nr:hypothetical protein BS47DRAFT_854475 [Hydnum rufescens UP504]
MRTFTLEGHFLVATDPSSFHMAACTLLLVFRIIAHSCGVLRQSLAPQPKLISILLLWTDATPQSWIQGSCWGLNQGSNLIVRPRTPGLRALTQYQPNP